MLFSARVPFRFLLIAFLLAAAWGSAAESIDLAGEWRFRMDPEDQGVSAQWFHTELPGRIQLPGSLQEQGYGNEVGVDTPWTGSIVNRMWHDEKRFAPYRQPDNIHIAFWLQPDRHYIGPAWYQRSVTIPRELAGKRFVLRLERCHWETRLWVDGEEAGTRNSLSTPHEYDLSDMLPPGEHTLTLRIDNTVKIDVGRNAHSVSDNTQTNWNGVIGEIALHVASPVWIDDVQVYPDVPGRRVRVRVTIAGGTEEPVEGTLALEAKTTAGDPPHTPPAVTRRFKGVEKRQELEIGYPLGKDARLWDEFSPNLYALTVALACDTGGVQDKQTVTFGLREFAADGTQFTLNGRKVFLRGTLECCIFPKTGYPPMDVDEWLRVLRAARAHGLNHLRFHSWCPPEAAFVAADQLGFIYQVECPAWARIGDGKPIDEFIYAEGDRILRAYGNHPSFCMLAYGNEPAGPKRDGFLTKLVHYWREKDPRRLYTSASGWPILDANQYHVTPKPRVHAWGEGVRSRFNAEPLQTRTDYRDFIQQYDVPVVSHEIGQWCVFPNLEETAKYTGSLKAKNFEITRDSLEANHMLDQAGDFLMASGKLQALCYKEEIEAALRTPGMGGFQLLDLHDFPGQGTALVGVLDPFWDEKGYISPEAYRRFAGDAVPLLRMDKCVWTTGETFAADAELAHFGPAPVEDAAFTWRVENESGTGLAAGRFDVEEAPIDNGIPLGTVEMALDGVAAPCKLRVTISSGNPRCRNGWDIWVYPETVDTAPPQGIHIARELDDAAQAVLRAGGKVMLLPAPGTVRGDKRGPVPVAFSPIFWNTFWTGFQPPHTLGILCDPAHPALAGFPTEFHSNWQWWDAIDGGQFMILDAFPPALQPIVQVIDDWNTCRRLALAFEVCAAGGKLLVCGSDLTTDLAERLVARQLRHSLLAYMASEAFAPKVEVACDVLHELFKPASFLAQRGATASADSAYRNHPPANAIDNNPSTIWHTDWQGDSIPGYPHWIALDLKQSCALRGLAVLPRQDMANGRVAEYAVYVSDTEEDWGRPVARGRLAPGAERAEILFNTPQRGRYVRFEARTPLHRDHPWASLAELDILPAETGG